ncbi:MAG TPA: methyltransferase domain-containing protein, partial [Clostridiales bacterium]|nr:methyltransferase domain-containing protein [Clostridiales bacterium]
YAIVITVVLLVCFYIFKIFCYSVVFHIFIILHFSTFFKIDFRAHACDLSAFSDKSFDIVLNMGPYYHLTEKALREQCISECLRVLKPNGLLAITYISRYFIFPFIATGNTEYLLNDLGNQLVNTGTLRHDSPNCFWTDTYYASPQEMEQLLRNHSLEIVDHFAQDGISTTLGEKIDRLNDEQFNIWCDYHYKTCREKSILGASNHSMIIGRKVK